MKKEKVKKIVAVLIVLFMVTSCVMMAGTVMAKGPGAEDKPGHGGAKAADDGELTALEDFRTGPTMGEKGAKGDVDVSNFPYGLPEELGIYQLTNVSGGCMHPIFSPDGTKIAYMNDSTNNRSIWVMELDFSSGTPVVVNNYPVTDPDVQCAHLEGWSPDGTKILFRSYYPGDYTVDRNRLWIANADGSGVYELKAGEGNDSCFGGPTLYQASFSPNGKKIVYTMGYDDVPGGTWIAKDIYVMNADGSGAVQLTDTYEECELSPRWSPDGSQILYKKCNDERMADLCVMDADGSNPRIVVGGVTANFFAWSPDGRWIVYEYRNTGTTIHEFTGTPTATAAGTLTASVRGDFDSSNEYANVYVEGTYIGEVAMVGGFPCDAGWAIGVFPITQAQIDEWNADGKIVVTVTNSRSVTDYCTDNEHSVQLTYGGYDVTSTEEFFTPDYRRDIYKVRPDGSGNTRLTPSDDYCEHTPLWGPDGTILYRSDELSISSTWVMNPDGSAKTMINPWGGMWHDWSPSGEWIVFQTCEPPTTASAQIFIMRNPLYTTKVPTLMPVGIIALIGLLTVVAAISIVRKREGK